jgi:hypothetical protein
MLHIVGREDNDNEDIKYKTKGYKRSVKMSSGTADRKQQIQQAAISK